jgi:hypothetical protein
MRRKARNIGRVLNFMDGWVGLEDGERLGEQTAERS